MNFKRILSILMICIFAFSGIGLAKAKSGGGSIKKSPAVTNSLTPSKSTTTPSTKTDAPKSNAVEQNKTTSSPNNSTSNTNNTSNTTKNDTNSNINKNTATNNNTATQNSGSRWGNTLRNIGLFAGGMFLGSMLSNMFGMGNFMGDILGLLANVVLIGVVVMILMAVFRKFFGKKNEGNVYASSQYEENTFRCNNCGWVSPDKNNPPKFCPECGNRLNGQNDDFNNQNYNQYNSEQDAEYTQQSSRKIIDITPPKDKDKF